MSSSETSSCEILFQGTAASSPVNGSRICVRDFGGAGDSYSISPSKGFSPSATAVTLLSSSERFQDELIHRPITPVDRLYYRRKNRLSHIREKTKEPDSVSPIGKLPLWERLRLEDKIPAPIVPNHKLIWTRGKLGQKLSRDSPFFHIFDEPGGSELDVLQYDALHDTNAQSYFRNPSVQKQLTSLGLLTPSGAVVCSLSQFNKWRSYINSQVYKHKIKKALDTFMEQEAANHAQKKQIQEYERQEAILSRQAHRMQRQVKAKEIQLMTQLIKWRKYEEQKRIKEERVVKAKLVLAGEQLNRIMKSHQHHDKKHFQLAQLRQREISTRDRLILRIVEKQMEAERQQIEKKEIKTLQMETQYADSLQAQCQLQAIENRRQDYVTGRIEKEMREAAARRQQEFQERWNKLAEKREVVEFKTEEEEFVEPDSPRDETIHEQTSVFHLPTVIGETLDFLNRNIGRKCSRPISAPPTQTEGLRDGKSVRPRCQTAINRIQLKPCSPSPSKVNLAALDTGKRKVSKPRKCKSVTIPSGRVSVPKPNASAGELEQNQKRVQKPISLKEKKKIGSFSRLQGGDSSSGTTPRMKHQTSSSSKMEFDESVPVEPLGQ